MIDLNYMKIIKKYDDFKIKNNILKIQQLIDDCHSKLKYERLNKREKKIINETIEFANSILICLKEELDSREYKSQIIKEWSEQ